MNVLPTPLIYLLWFLVIVFAGLTYVCDMMFGDWPERTGKGDGPFTCAVCHRSCFDNYYAEECRAHFCGFNCYFRHRLFFG